MSPRPPAQPRADPLDWRSTLAIPKLDKNQIKIVILRNSSTGRIAPGDWTITPSGAVVGTGADAGIYHGYLHATRSQEHSFDDLRVRTNKRGLHTGEEIFLFLRLSDMPSVGRTNLVSKS